MHTLNLMHIYFALNCICYRVIIMLIHLLYLEFIAFFTSFDMYYCVVSGPHTKHQNRNYQQMTKGAHQGVLCIVNNAAVPKPYNSM